MCWRRPGRPRSIHRESAARNVWRYCGSIQRCGLSLITGKPSLRNDGFQFRRRGVAQQAVEPRFQAGAVLDQHLGFRNRRNVLRRRLVRFGRCADRHDAGDAHFIAADALHERVERRDGRDDVDFAVVECARRRSAVVRRAAGNAQREGSALRRRNALTTCRARSGELHVVAVECETARREHGVGELLHRGAIDVFDASALSADRVMVMVLRLAVNVRRFARIVDASRDVAARLEMLERAINRRERDLGVDPVQLVLNVAGGQESAAGDGARWRSARADGWSTRLGFAPRRLFRNRSQIPG